MARLMSVSLTADAVVERRKTVTRRLGWYRDRNARRLVRPGDELHLCRKVMGRAAGEPLERLARVEVLDVTRQQLRIDNTGHDAELEGFPELTWRQFVEWYCETQRCRPSQVVTRIEWRYLDDHEHGAVHVVVASSKDTAERYIADQGLGGRVVAVWSHRTIGRLRGVASAQIHYARDLDDPGVDWWTDAERHLDLIRGAGR